jgi:cysteine desulfurase family protein (TIGR01976 family)
MTSPHYPLERIRATIPALVAGGDREPLAYFDGPGGTQVPRVVIDAVTEYLTSRNANTHGTFETSRATDETLALSRRAMATFLGGSPDEVVFGANMTSLTYALSRALGRGWGPGDELVVTELDHQANVAPWRQVAEDRGLTVHTVPIDRATCTLDLDALERVLSPRTRLVAVGAASNAIGTITDVGRVAALARAVGALCFVDAVHLAPHRAIDVDAIGCDFLACSAYKFFGPHVGVLWARRELLAEYRPYKVPPAADSGPERWETGTQNHEGIAGAAAAVAWIAGLGEADTRSATPDRRMLESAWSAIRAHEDRLLGALLDGLGSIRGVRIHGPGPGTERTPTVAISLPGLAPRQVAGHLARDGVNVWDGDFYAPTVIRALGLEPDGGVVRIGLAAYSSDRDVARLLESLAAVRNG